MPPKYCTCPNFVRRRIRQHQMMCQAICKAFDSVLKHTLRNETVASLNEHEAPKS
jgi:hypothetical protein